MRHIDREAETKRPCPECKGCPDCKGEHVVTCNVCRPPHPVDCKLCAVCGYCDGTHMVASAMLEAWYRNNPTPPEAA